MTIKSICGEKTIANPLINISNIYSPYRMNIKILSKKYAMFLRKIT